MSEPKEKKDKQLEEVKEPEKKYRTLIEVATDIVITIDLKTGNISSANRFAEQILGYDREDVLYKINFQDMLHPDDRERALTNLQDRITKDKRYPNAPFRLRKADGSYLDTEINGGVIYADDGTPLSYMAIIRDVTENKKVEEELRESEEKFLKAFHASPNVMSISRLSDGLIYEVNDSFVQTLGYSREELIGHTSVELKLYQNLKDREKYFGRIEKGKDTPATEILTRTKLGETRVLLVSAQIINLKNEQCIISAGNDITERKRTEEALKESEERYRKLFDSSSTGTCVVQDGKFQLVSSRIMEMTGYTEEEMIGMPFLDFIHPDERESLQEQAAQRLQGEEPGYYTYRAIRKDGEIIYVELFGTLISYQGQPAILVDIIDTTVRMRTEKALRESEERYRSLFEESRDVIYLSTPQGKFYDINPAGVELFGYSSKEEIFEIDIAKDLYVNEADRVEFQSLVAKHGYVKDHELLLKRKDGKEVVTLATTSAVRDKEGKVIAYRGTVRDITEQKQLEQQLLQAQKMQSLGTLAGGVAHDFNNILAGILGYASLLKTKISVDDPLFKYADTIEKSGMRAAELVDQLLGFARGGKYNPIPVQLNTVVRETLGIVERTFDKSIEIESNLQDDLPTIEADATQMQQVLMNLCVNAADAMPGGGKLIIDTGLEMFTDERASAGVGTSRGLSVALSVSDNGLGMDDEMIQRIFEPFFTTKEKGKGTGLGLSMVYGVVNNHGGHTQVVSKPGKGTAFKIYLPVSGEPEESEQTEPETIRGSNELILVVDDEEVVRSLATEILEDNGYRTLTAENGIEAVKAYQAHADEISLVILDMVMPKMGGHEAFLELKRINPEVKALLSSGYSHHGKAREILDSGAMGFVQKPYRADALLSKVRSALTAI